MKRFIAGFIAMLGFIFLITSLFMISIEVTAYDIDFYRAQFEKLDRAEVIGIEFEELMIVTDGLIDYLKDDRAALDMKADFDGELRQVFNEREISHMVDVKNLFILAGKIKWAGLAGAALLLIISLSITSRESTRRLSKSFIWAFIIFAGITSGAAYYAVTDFSSFWTNFHHIFFTNDLWLLDPSTDVLIMMVPEEFFFATVIRIVITFAAAVIVLLTSAILTLVLKKKKSY